MTASDPVHIQIGQWQRWSLLAGTAGVLLAIVGLILDREQLLRSYLFAYLFWTGMALGCLAILLLHHTVGGKWGMVIRRMCEAGSRTLPYMAILLIPILLSIPILYPWAKPEALHDANIQAKAGYLNVPFFLVRVVIYFLIWTFYGWRLSKWSALQDETTDRTSAEILIGKMR